MPDPAPSHPQASSTTLLFPSPPPAMYQSPSYSDAFFQPAHCNPGSNSQSQSSPPTPPPPGYHHHHHHGNSHLYPPSPPQGASPSSDRGSFLSPPASYASSLPSSYLQRSNSALSFHKRMLDHNHYYGGGGGSDHSTHLYDQPDFLDFQAAGPIRRVFSTGDIQGTNHLQPLAGENCSQEVGGNGAATATSGGKVGRYSAEERRERIERYRSKRSQRNFHKKITYACRKTLADSRPRIRGRFARNGETELEAEAEAEAGEVTSGAGGGGGISSHGGVDCYGWGPAVDDEEDYGCDVDPEFWSNFFNSLSMNSLNIPNDMYGHDG